MGHMEPHFEVANQGTLFPTLPGYRSLFQAIVIYLFIVYRKKEAAKRGLTDISVFILQPLID